MKNKLQIFLENKAASVSYGSILATITIIALALRAVLFFRTIDSAPDAYHRSYICYCWSLHPHIINGEIWPPALTYMGGILNCFAVDPLQALKVISFFCGAFSPLIFFVLLSRIFDRLSALISSFLLALLPLAASLSVSSLSESPYLFFFLSGFCCLLYASDSFQSEKKESCIMLFLSLMSFAIASAIRIESWFFIPVWSAYFYLKTRSKKASLLFLASLLAFPLYWILACHIRFDSALLSLNGPGVNVYYPEARIGYAAAAVLWVKNCLILLGPLIPLAILFAVVQKVLQKQSPIRHSAASILYITVSFLCLVLCILSIESFGNYVENRFFLISFTLLLPYAALGLKLVSKKEFSDRQTHTRAALASLILAISMLISVQCFKPNLHISSSPDQDIERLAKWLNSSEVEAKPILMTTLRWNFLGYRLALLCRNKFKQITVIDNYYSYLPVMQARVKKFPPQIMLASKHDFLVDIPYAKNAISFDLDPVALFKSGELAAYKITSSPKLVSPIKKCLSCWPLEKKTVSAASAELNYCDYQW